MPEKPVDAQAQQSAGEATVTEKPAVAAGAPPSQQGQPTIKIGDKEFRADDVTGILTAKAGLEAENKAIKAKLDAFETAQLSEKEKLEKQIKEQTEENARLKQTVINSKLSQALRDKGVTTIKAELLNLGVTDESQIESAVQKLISENPGLVNKLGVNFRPPGQSAPPGSPPGAIDKEAELAERYSKARTPAEIAAIDKEYYELRGMKPPEVRKVI